MTQKVLTISAGGVFTEAANAGELSFTPVNKAGDTGVGNLSMGALTATTVKVTSAGGYISSDHSTGITTTVTTASLVGKTLTIKDGIITGFA